MKKESHSSLVSSSEPIHELFMARCLELAQKGKGNVAPNPMVGCVIVYNGKIISEGYHNHYGGPHAEVVAINQLNESELIPKSTIYVNLEPCSHFGKTPPCADLIIQKGFKKVIIGAVDSNEQVAGSGIEKLKNAGIEVMYNILSEECRKVNAAFYTFHEKKRPYYILKWAESHDGFIYNSNQPAQLSNELSSQRVHLLRSEHAGIIIGKNTLLQDNPQLDVRFVKGKNPLRIVIVNQVLEEFWKTKLFSDGNPTLVFNTQKSELVNKLEFIQYNSKELVSTLNQELFKRNIQSVLVEGGTIILTQFINENNWDKAFQIKTEKEFQSGIQAPTIKSLKEESFKVNNDTWNVFSNTANK